MMPALTRATVGLSRRLGGAARFSYKAPAAKASAVTIAGASTKKRPPVTFFYDGGCPLCMREIGHWQRIIAAQGGADVVGVALQDISQGVGGSMLESDFGVSTSDAMARAHAVDSEGTLRTGMAAFAVVWERLPYWWWLSKLLKIPMALEVAEAAYAMWAKSRLSLGDKVGGRLAPPSAPAGPGASCRYVPGSGDKTNCS